MRHNCHIPGFRFHREPEHFSKATPKELLQYCLGATLYMPGTKDVRDKLMQGGLHHIASMVMCFEDAIAEREVRAAEDNVLLHLQTIARSIAKGELLVNDLPLIFLRVRNPQQFRGFVARMDAEQASVLTGFVFPKFYTSNAGEYLELLAECNARWGTKLYGMPILEGRAIAHRETRTEELKGLHAIVDPHKGALLNIRVGGTDFSSIFGVRRGITSSIYDILPVRDCLSDILNFFNREGADYTVSAPVWEYFLAHKKDDLSNLIERDMHHSLLSRATIVNEAIDGLLREVLLDKANGFVGKTIIHPSHAPFVNAMQAVTREEHDDAVQILATDGGVVKSASANKMNEANPHRNWAHRVVCRARAYGVVEDERAFLQLMLG